MPEVQALSEILLKILSHLEKYKALNRQLQSRPNNDDTQHNTDDSKALKKINTMEDETKTLKNKIKDMQIEIKHFNKAKLENELTIKKLQTDLSKQTIIEKNKSNNETQKPDEDTIKIPIAKEEKKETLNNKTISSTENLADTEKIVHKLRSELMEKDMNNRKLYEQISIMKNQINLLTV